MKFDPLAKKEPVPLGLRREPWYLVYDLGEKSGCGGVKALEFMLCKVVDYKERLDRAKQSKIRSFR